MPLFRKIECGKGWGGIWQTAETFDQLCGMWPGGEECRKSALRYASEKRRLEHVAVHRLIHALTGESLRVAHRPSGRPYLEGSALNLSISHTRGYAAVMFSQDHEVGTDIEAYSERILKLKERVVGGRETADTAYQLLLHWSAKEAAFKILDEEGIDFVEHLAVRNLDCVATPRCPQTSGECALDYHLADGKAGTLPINYETTSDYVFTYAFR